MILDLDIRTGARAGTCLRVGAGLCWRQTVDIVEDRVSAAVGFQGLDVICLLVLAVGCAGRGVGGGGVGRRG